eukprot:2581815-Rhodomonas_salina.2
MQARDCPEELAHEALVVCSECQQMEIKKFLLLDFVLKAIGIEPQLLVKQVEQLGVSQVGQPGSC